VDILMLFLMKQRNFSTLFGILLTQGMRELDFGLGDKLKTRAYGALMSA
jgi:hypothetical protein